MTLKEMNRLKSNCSATSSINALLIVHCLPLSFAMAMCHVPWPCAMAMPEHPYPCMKPLKHESMPETSCDMRYTNSLTPSPTAAKREILLSLSGDYCHGIYLLDLRLRLRCHLRSPSPRKVIVEPIFLFLEIDSRFCLQNIFMKKRIVIAYW